jgi:queuine tRNA-ribosyltransferase
LAGVCAAKPAELYTYTYSTSIRAAMLAAGFYVAKGRGTGPKAETTIGLSSRAAEVPHRHELLNGEWLAKWQRSEAQAPFGCVDQDWRSAVLAHPQFRAS